tara:strand:+ start:3831 stop:4178 length:348 start_codon:yes stop_codon:yes gene_type:complete
MADKQDRYRKRKSEQGFQRVEVLVPEVAAPHLKAYARALRDAHALGLEPPLFEGMGSSARKIPEAIMSSTTSAAQEYESKVNDQPVRPTPTVAAPRKDTREVNPRPDFSKGLLDD